MKQRVLAKTAPFHTLLKKRAQNGAVLNGTVAFLLPLDAQKTGEEESFVPLFSPSFLPPFSSKRRRPKTLSCLADSWPPTCLRNGGDVPPRAIVGRQYNGHPSHVSPLFSYKYRGDKENKRGDEKRTSEGTEESKQREKKKGEGQGAEQKREGAQD